MAGSDFLNVYQFANNESDKHATLRKWSQNTLSRANYPGYCDLNHIVVPVRGVARFH